MTLFILHSVLPPFEKLQRAPDPGQFSLSPFIRQVTQYLSRLPFFFAEFSLELFVFHVTKLTMLPRHFLRLNRMLGSEVDRDGFRRIFKRP